MLRLFLGLVTFVILSLTLTATAGAQQASPTPAPPPPPPVVSKLADDVYVFRQGGYNSLIILTDAGVLTTEPSSQFIQGRSETLKAEIAKLSSQPVRWVVFSHDHRDHNEGGHVFADTATLIAHAKAAPKIAARNDPRSPVPTVLVDDRLVLNLGGKRVDLIHMGRNHSDNSIVLFYPAARVAHAVDWAENGRLPFMAFPDGYLDDLTASLTRLGGNELDYTVLVAGHTADGSKASVLAQRTYLNDLQTAIRGARILGHADGSTFMAEYVTGELAPQYRGWVNFPAHLGANVTGMIRLWNERAAAAR